jgi:hypothetical protein
VGAITHWIVAKDATEKQLSNLGLESIEVPEAPEWRSAAHPELPGIGPAVETIAPQIAALTGGPALAVSAYDSDVATLAAADATGLVARLAINPRWGEDEVPDDVVFTPWLPDGWRETEFDAFASWSRAVPQPIDDDELRTLWPNEEQELAVLAEEPVMMLLARLGLPANSYDWIRQGYE